MPAKMTSEDFSQYGLRRRAGGAAARRRGRRRSAWSGEEGRRALPGTHSPQWAPDFKPTVVNTIKAETAILLDLFKGEKK